MNRLLYLGPHPRPQVLADHEVLTPNPRAARSLNVPARTLEGMALRRVREQGFDLAPALIAHRILRRTARDILEASDPEGTARSIALSVQTLLRTGADLELLAKLGSPRTRQLAELTAAYVSRLRSKKLIDPSEVIWQAVRQTNERRKVLVHGYFRPRVDELELINAIADEGSQFFLPCAEHPIFGENREAAEFLRLRGWQILEDGGGPTRLGDRLALSFLSRGPVPPDAEVYAFPNVDAEVRGALAQIKSRLVAGVAPDEIVLVARDDASYGPTVLSVAWEYGLPVRAYYAVPLSETRLGAWVSLLLEAVTSGLSFEPTARLLAQPLGPGLTDKQWREVRRRHPSDVSKWRACGVNLSSLAWGKSDTRAGWVSRLQNQVKVSELGRRAGFWAREIIAFHTLENELPILEDPGEEMLSIGAFAEEVLELLNILTVPAQPGSGGVELHTPLSIFGAHYKHVYVLGMNEGVFPAPVREDPLLDFYERRMLAEAGFELESATDVPRRETLSFYSLLQTASESFTLSYPKTVGESLSLPSPYISRLGIDPASCGLPPAAVSSIEELRRVFLRSDEVIEDPVMSRARHALVTELRRESVEAHDEYDGVLSMPLDLTDHVWSVSQLTSVGQCPFKWFSNKLLKLTEAEEAELTLSPGLRGRLYHKVIEFALGWASHAEDPRHVMIERLGEAFVKAEKALSLPALPAWGAQRAEHLKILRLAIEGPDFLQEGAEVLALEKRFEGEWYGLKVSGIVDRVDRTAEGLVLIDYKTSSSTPTGPKNEEGKTRLDIQLPLYMQTAAQSLFPDDTVAGAYYYSLTKGKILKKAKMDDSAPILAFVERVKEHLKDGSFPVDPDTELMACEFCDYDLACRKGQRLGRKGVSGETDG